MINLSRSSLPAILSYNGNHYEKNNALTALHEAGKPFDNKGCILLKVQHRELKGKLDIHDKPYKPTEWIFTLKK